MPTTDRKEVLTTGEVARICHVAPRTVSKWFDTGKLRGYRIPGSRDRRIPRKQLEAFMRAHGIPLDGMDGGNCRILLVDARVDEELLERMDGWDHYEVRTAENGFEAGLVAQKLRPHVIVLDVGDDREETLTIFRNIKQSADLQGAKVIATTTNSDSKRDGWLTERGFDGVLRKPYTPTELVDAIEKATNLIG